ncbi:MAG: response regulator transcription factor [Erysipelotrichia bacterium]|nr:response regulator transcription factor [Erysipelotrichia bacterium]NCC54507.1 response regulator transcription factor [Erysipelotrichia bacterium]
MKIVIVDDDKLVSASLKTIISSDEQIEVLAIGNNGEEAIQLYEQYRPDIMLMDIRMEKMSGLEAGEYLLKHYPHAKILYLTTFLDDEYIIKALRMGAKGYLLKQDFESIIPSLKAVASNQSIFGNEIISKIPNFLMANTSLNNYHLNEKELELLRCVADGLNNKEIANKLYLSEGTIRNYLSDLMNKLQVRDRTQLAILFYKQNKDLY